MVKTNKSSTYRKGIAALALSAALAGSFAPSIAFAEPVSVPAPVAQVGYADLVESVRPAVVSVRVNKEVKRNTHPAGPMLSPYGLDGLPDNHPFKRFFRDFGFENNPELFRNRGGAKQKRVMGQGSGFFISDDGYIVTNNHVIADGDEYSIVMDDGKKYDAKLVGADPRTDVAVLKVDADDKKFTYVSFADDNTARVGDMVVAVGNPFGLGGTVTAGIVSARGRDIGAGSYDDFIQIDAAVNKGNSGGPAFNLTGQVIGINTAIFSPSGGNVGIAFAIPASTAKTVVDQLIKNGEVERGWIGVQIQPVTDDIASSLGLSDEKGALVAVVTKDSPTDKAGVKVGDVITALNGEVIEDPRDLSRKVAPIVPGEDVELTIWRDGEAQNITVTIGAMPKDVDEPANPSKSENKKAKEQELDEFGLTVDSSEKDGLKIISVERDSDAEIKGIRPGDIIVSVNNQDADSIKDVEATIKNAKKAGRKAVLFQIKNEMGNRFVALSIEK